MLDSIIVIIIIIIILTPPPQQAVQGHCMPSVHHSPLSAYPPSQQDGSLIMSTSSSSSWGLGQPVLVWRLK